MLDYAALSALAAVLREGSFERAARALHVTPSAVSQRVRALEEAGVIQGYRALIDEKTLGFDVTLFAFISLTSQSEAEILAFEARVKNWPLVRESWMQSGEIDFILKCVAPDLKTCQTFVIEQLVALPNVGQVRTSLTLRQIKNEPVVV